MLTIFTCPKAFADPHINTIQRNAIKSWIRLQPKCEIILIGDDKGVADVARELGLKHIPLVEKNESGTPLVSSVFEKAERNASGELLCYVNADIMFPSNFAEMSHKVRNRRFLAVGRRWCVNTVQVMNFEEPSSDSVSWEKLKSDGRMDESNAIDYFVFTRGLWSRIPPFAIGRTVWDNWLIYSVRAMGMQVVDVTECLQVIHQDHAYSHCAGGKEAIWSGAEAKANLELAGGFGHIFTIDDATHQLTPEGIVPFCDKEHLLKRAERLSVLRPALSSIPSWKMKKVLCWLFPNL